MQKQGFSVVPLAILALVVGAAVLLVAGYGAVVGAGLLIGLGLGGAVGLVGVLWIGAGPGRSIGLGPVTFLSPTMGGHGTVELPDWIHDAERVMGVDISPLRRIVAIGQAVEAGGVTVEFTILELREAGGVISALVHTPPPNASAVGGCSGKRQIRHVLVEARQSWPRIGRSGASSVAVDLALSTAGAARGTA